MAQRVVVTLSDDIEGGAAAETVAFGLDGKTYEIDLNAANAEKLRKALAPYLAAARKIPVRIGAGAGAGSGGGSGAGGGRGRGPAAAYTHTDLAPDPAAVRAWAQSNKMDVPARGRIPKRVYEAFREAS
ncbi:histone-like nucleoid-structuring protein Lsr2 [Streptomyces bikiniensis]|uniref:histone-like nucleoid-structuring protein Lsr2 n=1 Tax=Streptomyces bikiniensis TaxID=1896 RepID=UPI0004C23768|nr:Lsr2 family protein [Streptomyces bikiniensis]